MPGIHVRFFVMETLPAGLGLAFGLTTALTVGLFSHAAQESRRTGLVLLALLLVQAALGLSGFFRVPDTRPPRLILLLGPPLLVIIALFNTMVGRRFLDSLRLQALTLLHIVRIPVELVLFGLFLHRGVPKLMTFEGRNWDILAGLTAPVVWYFAFHGRQLGRRGLLLWNVLCLVSLLNIVANAVLSAPSPFQQFAFEQPNVAIQQFPYVWLPGCVVPVVLLAHLAAMRHLLTDAKKPAAVGSVATMV